MPITVQPVVQADPPGQPLAVAVVTPGVPQIDGCQILTRARAFVVDQGSVPTLEYTFRDRRSGAPVDLTQLFGAGGDSVSSPGWTGQVRVRVKEAVARGDVSDNPVYELKAVPHAPAAGVVRVGLDPRITAAAGVYFMSWGVENVAGQMLLVNNTLLSVERSLFAPSLDTVTSWVGPMTLGEVRTAIRDSESTENLRLDDVEFSDDEILDAIIRPLEYWNEMPPPLRPQATTRNFTYRFHWRQGTVARLYLMAANWYRRNKQQLQAGGLADDDLNRDQAYDGKGQQLWQEYTDWVKLKKLQLNTALFAGVISSPFTGYH